MFNRPTKNRNRWSRQAALASVLVLAGIPVFAAPAFESKINSRIDELAESNPYGELSLIVSFRSTPHAGQIQLLESLRGRSIQALVSVNAYAVKMAAVDALVLRDRSDVDYVTLDAPVRSSQDASAESPDSSGTPEILSGVTGRGVTVAVLDSGIADHADLVGSVIATVDLTGGSALLASPRDPFGHGTHVAGIISSLSAGIAPGSPLVSVRVLDEFGVGATSTVIRGIEWAMAHREQYGIRILNLSLGRPIYESVERDPLVRAVEKACSEGLVVVTAAGNHGQNGNFTVTSPGNAPNAISVGSSTDGDTVAFDANVGSQTDGDTVTLGAAVGSSTDGDTVAFDANVGSQTDGDTVATDTANAAVGSSTDGDTFNVGGAYVSSFSSRGPSYIDHVLKPDLVAPGNRIVSLRVPGSTLDTEFPERRVAADGLSAPSFFEMSGTSVAAPMVAASAAVMLARDPNLDPATIKARLMLSANKDLDESPFARGAGRLNLQAALAREGHAASSASPRVRRAAVCCDVVIDDMSEQWSDPALWGAEATWGDAGLWGDQSLWGDDPLWGDAALWNEPASFSDAMPLSD